MLERLAIATTCSCFFSTKNPTTTTSHFPSLSSDCKLTFLSFSSQQPKKQTSWFTFCTSYEVGGGFPDEDFGVKIGTQAKKDEKWDPSHYEALLRGGEQVTSVLEEMVKILEDMSMDEASEEVAVELAAQGVIGKRVDEMESGFMMALDYMIELAERDNDTQLKAVNVGP